MKNISLYIRVSTEDQTKEGYPPRFAIANLISGTSSLEVQRGVSWLYFNSRLEAEIVV